MRAIGPGSEVATNGPAVPHSTLEVAGYAVDLARVLADFGHHPRQLEVQATLRTAPAGSACWVDLYVLGDAPDIDEARLNTIAKLVLDERKARGAWQLDSEASVRARNVSDPFPAVPTHAPERDLVALEPRASQPATPAPALGNVSTGLSLSPNKPGRIASLLEQARLSPAVAAKLLLRGGLAYLVVTAALTAAIQYSAGFSVEPSARLRQFVATHGQVASSPGVPGSVVIPPTGDDADEPTAAPTRPNLAPSPVTPPPSAAVPPMLPAFPLPKLKVSDGQLSTVSWPKDASPTAWLAQDGYHLFARQAQKFVAVGIEQQPLHDVVISATFHKVDGPVGGGYGIIVRDQGPQPRDGLNQSGHYDVLEVGDRGEVGIWRREQDRWVDLLPWTPATAVNQDVGENQLLVRAAGDQLTFWVNGAEVASVSDPVLAGGGGVGVFTGGDGNHTLLTHFTIQQAN